MTEREMHRFVEQCNAQYPDIRWMATLQDDGDRLSLCGVRDGVSHVARSGQGTSRTPQDAVKLVIARLERLTD